jgi:CheY-like chemotaxis protein
MPADRRPHILVVDDEPALRRLLVRAMESDGYEVVAVNDGAAGLEAARTADPPYDLVITNNCMPHMNGAELVAHLQSLFPGLPILHLDDLTRPSAEEVTAPTMTKPFSLDRLSDAVRKLLATRVTEE